MKSNSDKVKDWRKNTKIRIVSAMGGRCQICGYNKCNNALELHHIDPSQKELSFSKIRANPKSWDKIVTELKKSILLCSNCHKEVHAGIADLPETYSVFDESYTNYKNHNTRTDVCQDDNCNNLLSDSQKKYCSIECSNKNMPDATKYDWSDLYDLKYNQKLSNTSIAKLKGCSETSIRKNLRKLRV